MRVALLAVAVGLACLPGSASARAYSFDPSMLGVSGSTADMSIINEGGQLPGTYMVDVILNGNMVDARDVVFKRPEEAAGGSGLAPCLSVEQLSLYGVNVKKYPELSAGGECARLSAIPEAKADFQFYSQQLLLSVPQVSMMPVESGIAPQKLWDDGIPALMLGYSANTTRTDNRDGGNNSNTNSSYIQLNPGANLGPWRLRNQTNWSKQGDGGQWQTVYTYAERGLNDIKSRFTLGDRSTPDDVFDSVPFRGMMLGSDDNMVPYNQREYSPVIHGISRTQARVEVKQNGYTVYSQTVAPGPFALTDLNVSGGDTGGDLQVTIWETDGSPQVFTVPFQTPAISLHEGYLKYNLMGGRYRPSDSGVDNTVGQATVMYGLPWNLTLYGGSQGANHYQSVAVGVGISLGDWGAVSVDADGSHGQRKDENTENGTAWRIRYSKDVASTGTTMTMTSYQYASSGYNTLSDVLDTWQGDAYSSDWQNGSSPNDRQKSMSSVSLSQSSGKWGYLSLNGSRTDYWSRTGHDDNYGVSYGLGIYAASVTLSLSRSQQYNDDGGRRSDTISSIYVSVPLDRLLRSSSGSTLNATYQMNSSKEMDSNQVGLTGNSFNNQLNWDVSQNYQTGDRVTDKNNSAMHATWYGRYGQVGGNYSYSTHQRVMGGNVTGGIVASQQGITLGQTLGDTTALIEAPGASGVPVSGFPGISTDFRGYTTKAYLTPYQENTISLDPTALPPDAEIIQTDVKVVPTSGAIIPAVFRTRVGGRAMMTMTRPDGSPVPFGSMAVMDDGKGHKVTAGIVGDKGVVYLTGLSPEGTLTVRQSETNQCSVSYALPEDGKAKGPSGIYSVKAVCR